MSHETLFGLHWSSFFVQIDGGAADRLLKNPSSQKSFPSKIILVQIRENEAFKGLPLRDLCADTEEHAYQQRNESHYSGKLF